MERWMQWSPLSCVCSLEGKRNKLVLWEKSSQICGNLGWLSRGGDVSARKTRWIEASLPQREGMQADAAASLLLRQGSAGRCSSMLKGLGRKLVLYFAKQNSSIWLHKKKLHTQWRLIRNRTLKCSFLLPTCSSLPCGSRYSPPGH